VGINELTGMFSNSGRAIDKKFKIMMKEGSEMDGINRHNSALHKAMETNQEKELLNKQIGIARRLKHDY